MNFFLDHQKFFKNEAIQRTMYGLQIQILNTFGLQIRMDRRNSIHSDCKSEWTDGIQYIRIANPNGRELSIIDNLKQIVKKKSKIIFNINILFYLCSQKAYEKNFKPFYNKRIHIKSIFL